MPLANRLCSQYKLIIDSWPIDPLRPTISFRETLAQRADSYFGSLVETDAAIPARKTAASHPPPAPAGGVVAAAAVESGRKQSFELDAASIQKEINILGNLLEDRFKNAYPLGETMLRPKSNPDYYDKLLKELDQAPQRGWLQSKLNSWRGWIRLG